MSKKSLRRYTDLTSLAYTLINEKITLLNPGTWDDRNDSYYLRLYGKKKKLASVLALCFAEAAETYHHWKVFAPGPSGICIHFRQEELLDALNACHEVRSGSVDYKTMNELAAMQPATEDLPFVKRFAFQDEKEFRIIYDSKKEKLRKRDFPVPRSVIEKVTLSPWIHPDLADSAKTLFHSLLNWKDLTIDRSSLIENEKWKELGESTAAVMQSQNRGVSGVTAHATFVNKTKPSGRPAKSPLSLPLGICWGSSCESSRMRASQPRGTCWRKSKIDAKCRQ